MVPPTLRMATITMVNGNRRVITEKRAKDAPRKLKQGQQDGLGGEGTLCQA